MRRDVKLALVLGVVLAAAAVVLRGDLVLLLLRCGLVSYKTAGVAEPLPDAVWGPIAASTPTPPDSSGGFTAIELHPPQEYDGKTRDQILRIRTARVNEHPEALVAFASRKWLPGVQLFGQIADGKPWWGLVGIARYGSGEKSIEGDSEESRFIENPLLLFAPMETYAHDSADATGGSTPLWPRARSLAWDFNRRTGWATIDVTGYFNECTRLEWPDCVDRTLTLTAYNILDYGVPYFAFDAERSHGLEGSFDQVIREPEFIHLGRSCGYQGGCNNCSPYVPGLIVKPRELPARLVVRLFRNEPKNAHETPNAWFVVEML